MDGSLEAVHDRWLEPTEAALRRLIEGKSQKDLATLAKREDLAVALGKELPTVKYPPQAPARYVALRLRNIPPPIHWSFTPSA